MAKLTAYYIRLKVYCTDNNQAKAVQTVADEVSNDVDIVAENVIGIYAGFKRNKSIVVPAIKDVMKNGLAAISRHILTLKNIK